VIDLDYPPFFIDRVEDALAPCPQAPQIRRPVWERLRRPRLIGELADSIPERSDTDVIVAEKVRRPVQGLDLPVDLIALVSGHHQLVFLQAGFCISLTVQNSVVLAGLSPCQASQEQLVGFLTGLIWME
jgi:hypothetical protein